MKLTPSEINENHINNSISIYGIVLHIRELGKKKFIILTDSKNIIQVVYNGNEKIRRGDSIKVTGTLKKDNRAPTGLELKAEKLDILSKSPEEVFDQWAFKKMTRDKKIKYRTLTMRVPELSEVFRVFQKVTQAFREYYKNKGFLEVFTPKVVIMGTESGSEVFSILYFDKEAFLAQSPQLYKQMLMASGVKGVFEVGPYWRAEASFTPRHLTEFHGFDVEVNYIEDFNEIMDLIEDSIKYVLSKFNIKIKEIPRITFKEAKDILKSEYNIKIKDDLTTEAEKLLGTYFKEKEDSDFVFVTEFPYESGPFYRMKKEDDPIYTYSFDLLYKGIEILSGAQREHRYNILLNQIKEKGINPDRMKYYLETFKHGIPPHGGFGIGLDRFVKQLLDMPSVEDVVLWPRNPDLLEP